MIIVDTALKAREEAGNPLRVAMVGAGFMAQGIANQILNSVPGMELVAIANRTLEKAELAYTQAGAENVLRVSDVGGLEDAVRQTGKPAVTNDALLLCKADGIEAIIDVTGAVEFGAHVALAAIEHGKHLILMNAELDATIGPILKVYADKAGVVYSGSDGDQPGVEMNLYRFVKEYRLDPAAVRQHQGAYTTPTATRRPSKRSPKSGGRTQRWSPLLPTAPRFRLSKPSLPTPPG